MEGEQNLEDKSKKLFAVWINSEATKATIKKHRGEIKVPARIIWLPCNCTRERGWEGDLDSWNIQKKDESIYNHKECGSDFNL